MLEILVVDDEPSIRIPLGHALRARGHRVATASDGAEAHGDITVIYTPGVQDPVLPVELVALHNRLLEQKLIELRRGRIDTERARAEETRKELAIQIERELAELRMALAGAQ